MKKPHPRPEKDFRVTSLAWDFDIERRQADAGFEAVARETILRRHFQFLSFLQRHGLTKRIVCASFADLKDDAEWRNSDLTDDGFYFVQRFHGRWQDRKRKDRGEEGEEAFLRKWLAEFRSEKRPNQPPEPTRMSVTPAADAPVAPAKRVAHL